MAIDVREWGLRVRNAALGAAVAGMVAATGASALSRPIIPIPPNGIATRTPKVGVDELDQRQADALLKLRGGAAAAGW
jgi:hypothetical protein